MERFISADYILPVIGKPLVEGVLAVDAEGTITGLYEKNSSALSGREIERHEGILVPGFVNTHCHLELSHMKGLILEKTGLVDFIKQIITKREADPGQVEEAMFAADEEMYRNGIVAVGDISNTTASAAVKRKSRIHYHTFVEVLGFVPEKAGQVIREGHKIKEAFQGLPASITPHAPYSVSKELLREIRKCCNESPNLISIHNQESEEENKFFRYKTGKFLELYEWLKLNIDFFRPQARNSIQTVVPLLPSQQAILLVHNTFTSLKDIYFARRFNREITWCFCPNANRYIEGRLPKIDLFQSLNIEITLGTDSLASNQQLSILEEMKLIHEQYPNLSLLKTICWATLNGAKFLGLEKELGSFEPGKRPGINLIKAADGIRLTPESTVERLV